MTMIALVVPFSFMDALCSAGSLLAFQLTNSSLILVRSDEVENYTEARRQMVVFSFSSLCAVVLSNVIVQCSLNGLSWLAVGFFGVISLACAWRLSKLCSGARKPTYVGYRVWGVPWLQCVSILINWQLLASLELWMLLVFIALGALAFVFYICVGLPHSVGNNTAWAAAEENGTDLRTLLLDDI